MPRLTPLATLVPALMALSSGIATAADTGDAPESYGTATHAVVAGSARLGQEGPDDNEPVAGPAADGDDNANGDDEDGVFAFPELVQNGKAYSTNVFASNPGTTPASLVGWVDFDGNGRFDADEAASASVPAGADDEKFKLLWNDLTGVSSAFSGDTYARFRISSDAIGGADASGAASDGEVEDYTFRILEDVDGDEVPDERDTDNDNDGIPDEVEVIGIDTDGDGTPDYLDGDSDGDLVPDFVEAGPLPATPVDTDGDGTPDYLDLDSDDDGTPDATRITDDVDGDGLAGAVEGPGDDDGDGVPNTDDLDSDNDLIPDAVEAGGDLAAPVDSDGDGVPDFLDVDSDGDGVPDLFESNGGELDVVPFDADGDGRADASRAGGVNGIDDAAETGPDSGIPRFVVVDSDGDGTRDYLDTDSDGDGVPDVVEAGGTDDDANGLVDASADANGDGLADAAGNALTRGEPLPDTDGDGVPDLRDPDAVGGDGSGRPVGDGTTDAGGADGGADGGTTDAGGADGGVTDAGGTDGGATDAGDADGGVADAGGVDGGAGDAGNVEGGATDAGGTDGVEPGTTDAGGADGGGRPTPAAWTAASRGPATTRRAGRRGSRPASPATAAAPSTRPRPATPCCRALPSRRCCSGGAAGPRRPGADAAGGAFASRSVSPGSGASPIEARSEGNQNYLPSRNGERIPGREHRTVPVRSLPHPAKPCRFPESRAEHARSETTGSDLWFCNPLFMRTFCRSCSSCRDRSCRTLRRTLAAAAGARGAVIPRQRSIGRSHA